jgi:hypothetical protein
LSRQNAARTNRRFKLNKRRQFFTGMHKKASDSTKALGFAAGEIAVGLVRLDYSAEIVQHANVCPVRAQERAVIRVRDRVTDRVWP